MKWYSFLCKITGKHAYSITTSQEFAQTMEDWFLKLLKSMPFSTVTLYSKYFIWIRTVIIEDCLLYPIVCQQNYLGWAEFLNLLAFSQKIKCISLSFKINGLSSSQWIKKTTTTTTKKNPKKRCYPWSLKMTKKWQHSMLQITLN